MNARNLQVFLLALLLAAVGLGVFYYKWQELEFPLTPTKTYTSWYVEARLEVQPPSRRSRDKAMQVDMKLPAASSNYVIVDENIVASGFGSEIRERDGERIVSFSRRKVDEKETLFYRAIIYQLDSPASSTQQKPDSNEPSELTDLLDNEEEESPLLLSLNALVEEAENKSASDTTFVREVLRLVQNDKDDRIEIIRNSVNEPVTTIQLARWLMEMRDIPVRTVHGISLMHDQRQAQFVDWLEVYINKKWRAIDPYDLSFDLKQQYLPWWYGGDALLADKNGRADANISVKKNTNNALTRAIWKSGQVADLFLTFSFFNLPLDTQLVFRVLMLIPIGGLVIAFLRQVIGVKTFGTFMPVLIALSFRETGLTSGILLFTIIVALGLFIRSYFDRLQLLLVPRLAAVLTIVVILLGFMAVITNEMGYSIGLSIALFPIVILTMTIERMSLIWEEVGPKDAVIIGIGSLVAAVIGYFAMNMELVNHLVFAFPELLLVVLALNLLLGRYTGYKLTEYMRFQALKRSAKELNKG